MRSGFRAALILAGCLALLVTGVGAPSHGEWTATGRPIMWGVHVENLEDPPPGLTPRQAAILSLESKIGRKFDLDRQFRRWDDVFPDEYDTWTRDQGRTLFLSWQARYRPPPDNKRVSWVAITRGDFDDVVRDRARRIKAFGARIFFSFNPEPEGDLAGFQTPGDFAAAWRHVWSVFKEEGVTNVTWVWIMSSYTFGPKGTGGDKYYPGNQYVDYVGLDAYNWYGCRYHSSTNWQSFAQLFNPGRLFAVAHSKPVIAAEVGSVEDPANSGRKAQWFQDAYLTLQSAEWSLFKGFTYFHFRHIAPDRDCDWRVDSSESSLLSYRVMGYMASLLKDVPV